MIRRTLAATLGAWLGACICLAAGCGEPPDLILGSGITDQLDATDLDEMMLGFEYGISVAEIELMLAISKNGARIVSHPARRYVLYTLLLQPDERGSLVVSSDDFDAIVVVAARDGTVVGAGNDRPDPTGMETDAELVLDNPLNQNMTVWVVVTDFGTPTGGAFSVAVTPE